MLMEEKVLLKVALMASLLGLLVLMIVSAKFSPQINALPIALAQDKESGEQITVAGEVKQVKDTPSVIILTLADESGDIEVIMEKKEMQEKDLEGKTIQVEGIIKEYQNKKEIEAIKTTVWE